MNTSHQRVNQHDPPNRINQHDYRKAIAVGSKT